MSIKCSSQVEIIKSSPAFPLLPKLYITIFRNVVGRIHILGTEEECAELAFVVNNDEQQALEDLMTVIAASTF